MKKRLIAVVSMLLVCALLFCACGTTASNDKGSSSETTALNLATGGTTGTYYAYGGVISQILNDKLDNVELTVQSTGASKANIFSIDDGEADLAIVQNDVMYYAYNGTDLFEEDGAITSFSTVAALYAEVCQIVTTTKITSIEDLKGMRVSVGDAGSGVEFNARQILEAYDITFDDITVQNLSFGDSADALKNGKIDAFFCTAGAPTTAIVELATTNDINILTIDDAHAEKLIKSYPFYTQYTIPAGSYNGVDEDVVTVAVKATLIASNELSDEVITSIVKSLFDYKEEITDSHAKGAELDPAYAVAGIEVPFHPGAESYFTEVGALS